MNQQLPRGKRRRLGDTTPPSPPSNNDEAKSSDDAATGAPPSAGGRDRSARWMRMKAAGRSTDELRIAGCSAAEWKACGWSAEEAKPPPHSRTSTLTTRRMKVTLMMHKTRLEIEYPWRHVLKFVSGEYVRAPGYTAAEMMRGGFPALSIWTPSATIECGVSFIDVGGGVVAVNLTSGVETVVITAAIKIDCFACCVEVVASAAAKQCVIAFE